ncbi:hypothetical protein WA158_006645 [Blastocystis sp. Blastoise]
MSINDIIQLIYSLVSVVCVGIIVYLTMQYWWKRENWEGFIKKFFFYTIQTNLMILIYFLITLISLSFSFHQVLTHWAFIIFQYLVYIRSFTTMLVFWIVLYPQSKKQESTYDEEFEKLCKHRHLTTILFVLADFFLFSEKPVSIHLTPLVPIIDALLYFVICIILGSFCWSDHWFPYDFMNPTKMGKKLWICILIFFVYYYLITHLFYAIRFYLDLIGIRY